MAIGSVPRSRVRLVFRGYLLQSAKMLLITMLSVGWALLPVSIKSGRSAQPAMPMDSRY